MKFVPGAGVGLLLALLAAGSARSQVPAAAADASLRAFLPQFEAGISRFPNGDPTLWKQHASRRDEATLMGASSEQRLSEDQSLRASSALTNRHVRQTRPERTGASRRTDIAGSHH